MSGFNCCTFCEKSVLKNGEFVPKYINAWACPCEKYRKENEIQKERIKNVK